MMVSSLRHGLLEFTKAASERDERRDGGKGLGSANGFRKVKQRYPRSLLFSYSPLLSRVEWRTETFTIQDVMMALL